jgi:predicted nucleic acid-binding protein
VKVLFDTNVVLDVMLEREPFVRDAAKLMSRVEKGDIDGLLCATTITTIHYLATKVVGSKKTRQELSKLLALFEVASVNRLVIAGALESKLVDFEDAVLHEAARHADGRAIVTRDPADFRLAALPVYSPGDLLSLLETTDRQ